MSYAVQQTYSRKQVFWLGFVVALHILLAYALVNGLARKVVNIIKEPLIVSIVEEVKVQPPPPPPKAQPLPPRVNAPPPPFVPPVEVPVQTTQAPITTSQAPAPPAPPAQTVAAAPAVVNVSVVCPNSNEISRDVPFPPQADRLGLSGEVLVEFVVTPSGSVKDVVIKRSSNKLFNSTAIAAVGKLRCTGKGQDVSAVMPFVFQRN